MKLSRLIKIVSHKNCRVISSTTMNLSRNHISYEKIDPKTEMRRYFEENIRAKDEIIRAKDEIIKAKDEIIRAKDEVIRGRDNTLNAKEEIIKMLKSDIARNNTIIHQLQGRLSLRSVMEDFEQQFRNQYSQVGQGGTQRDQTWNLILKNNYNNISEVLGEASSSKWVLVAKKLFRHISDDVHKYRSTKVIINRASMSIDMVTLASAICKVFPIEYEIISPLP